MKEKPKSGPVKVAGPGGGVARSIGSKPEPELVAEPEAPKSRFTLEECRRFAECGFQKGSVSNPTNYARAIHRSGAVDGTIERFLWEEKFRLERQQEVALIEARHKQEIEELEKAVGQATRAWAAERAARVRGESFAGALFVLCVVILCGALWVGLGPWVVGRWRAARETRAIVRPPASESAGQRPSAAPGAPPGASDTRQRQKSPTDGGNKRVED